MSNLRNSLATAVAIGVTAAVANPATAAQQGDKKIITDAVLDTVTPIVAHATNNEPWYQSRVTIGAIVTMASPIIGQIIGHQVTPEEQQLVTVVVSGGLAAIGAAVSLYGRWVAKWPIGG